jgi:hypothetical protein
VNPGLDRSYIYVETVDFNQDVRMMEWVLVALFIAAIVLFIWSIRLSNESSKKIEQQIEDISFTFMDEVNKLQNQIRNVELDMEITAVQADINLKNASQRIVVREMLDLYKRGYSVESIAEKQQLSVSEAQRLLSPFQQMNERRTTANDL